MGTIKQTYQSRLFNDEELKQPDHDAIVRWVDRTVRERPCSLLDLLGIGYMVDEAGTPRGWHRHDPHLSFIMAQSPTTQARYDNGLKALLATAPNEPTPPPIDISSPVWEPSVVSKNGAVVGANDLSVTVTVRSVGLHGDFSDEERPRKVGWTYYQPKSTKVVFEAKSRIGTMGELLRQMQFYRTHMPNAVFVVVAPAAEFRGETRQILKEQNIVPLTYLSNI